MKKVTFGDVEIGQEFVYGGDLWIKMPYAIRSNRQGNANCYRVHDSTVDTTLGDDIPVWAMDKNEPRENVVDACVLTATVQTPRTPLRVPAWIPELTKETWNMRKVRAMRKWTQS